MLFLLTSSKNCVKVLAAHAALFLFVIQPIRTLICGAAVTIAFIVV